MLILLDRVCTDGVQGGNQITLKACDYQYPPTSPRSHMIKSKIIIELSGHQIN